MKELLKIAVYALLAAALSPMIGFWVVALVGSTMALVPLSILLSKLFPETSKHVAHSLLGDDPSLLAS